MNEHIRQFYIWTGMGENRIWQTGDYFGAWVFSILVALLLLGVFMLILSWWNYRTGKWHAFYGSVIDMKFVPSDRYADRWTVTIRKPTGGIETVSVTQQQYYDTKVQQPIMFYKLRGGFNKDWVGITIDKPKNIYKSLINTAE